MYSKYHGCGNDFILGKYQENIDYSEFAKRVCDRHTGIGADGLLIAKSDNNLLEMIFYNADGSRAPMCGNGIRCFALYCLDEGLTDKDNFDVLTIPGIMKVKVTSKNPFLCCVNLGKPDFSSEKLEIKTSKETFLDEKIELIDKDIIKEVIVDAVYMATHHLVVIVKNLEEICKSNIGEQLCSYHLFKRGINVNFVQIIDCENVKMKTYERGVGWTLACGTGASASFVILNKKGLCDEKIKVHLEKGTLEIGYNKNKEVMMEGPAICIAKNIDVLGF